MTSVMTSVDRSLRPQSLPLRSACCRQQEVSQWRDRSADRCSRGSGAITGFPAPSAEQGPGTARAADLLEGRAVRR